MIQEATILKEIGFLNPNLNGLKTHFILDCPFCGKEQHLYLRRKTHLKNKRGKNASYNFHCKKCNEGGYLRKFLKVIDKESLINSKYTDIISTNFIKLGEIKKEEMVFPKKIELPYDFEEIEHHPYLYRRGFEDWQYKRYNVGISNYIKHRERVIFILKMFNEPYAYLGRSTLSKQEIDRINHLKKLKGIKRKYLRYENSNSEFSKLLFGFDEIDFALTRKLILCEGIFDKASIDRAINVNNQSETRCVCLNGKSLSVDHYNLIKKYTSVEELIYFFDPDAFSHTQIEAFKYNHFNATVCYHNRLDPGDLPETIINDLIEKRDSRLNFFLKVSKNET